MNFYSPQHRSAVELLGRNRTKRLPIALAILVIGLLSAGLWVGIVALLHLVIRLV